MRGQRERQKWGKQTRGKGRVGNEGWKRDREREREKAKRGKESYVQYMYHHYSTWLYIYMSSHNLAHTYMHMVVI